jgi:hypothetical protein
MLITLMISDLVSGVMSSESRPGKFLLMYLHLTLSSSFPHQAKDARDVKFQCRRCDFGNEILPHPHPVNSDYLFAFEFAPKIVSIHAESVITGCLLLRIGGFKIW